MSSIVDVLAADLAPGDLIDLTPLSDRAAEPLADVDRYAATDEYATVTAVAEHGGHVDIGTDIFDIRLKATDHVGRLADD